ncbi:MAG: ATP-dependent DNA helicase PcrA [Alphaproteobacteria bacterium ADurb.Bin438]|nr:MAG: ATP-dependent DNA helicase PcrA [Alphaproteobacteria bacterium ADurb.Bin438]
MLEELNQEQKEAVTTTEGPLLVLAGAGTGKTKVLTTRLAYIINQGKARPYECLAVTFTNKASNEMKERLASMIGHQNANDLWMGTFHSICLRILRANCERIGYQKDFIILNEDDSEKIVKEILGDSDKYSPKNILNAISRWKDQALNHLKVNTSGSEFLVDARNIYTLYQKRLKEMNALDFGDLILNCIELFNLDKDILEKYQRKFKYIMVDEYQDTNTAQYLWLKLLAYGHNNIACVGDDDQSIYAWRGAEIGNILRFEKDFKNAKVIRLESNYRSTKNILDCASKLISHNEQRLGKDLRVAPLMNGDGEKVMVRGLFNDLAEAAFISDAIRLAINDGVNPNKFAILVRASFLTRLFEEAFLVRNIKYKITGGLRFYERKEVMDLMAYLRLLVHKNDDLAFLRIINVPKRAIGNATVDSIKEYARFKGLSLYDGAKEMVKEDLLKKAASKSVLSFINLFESWDNELDNMEHFELLKKIVDEIDYPNKMKLDKDKTSNINELIKSLADFKTIENLLEHVSLNFGDEADKTDDKVSIMTLHGAKGLEFDYVFLPGWEDGIFPSSRTVDEKADEGIEEERRLAYVGITRGRKNVVISFANSRRVYDQWYHSNPSRFLSELPQENIRVWLDRGVSMRMRENEKQY